MMDEMELSKRNDTNISVLRLTLLWMIFTATSFVVGLWVSSGLQLFFYWRFIEITQDPDVISVLDGFVMFRLWSCAGIRARFGGLLLSWKKRWFLLGGSNDDRDVIGGNDRKNDIHLCHSLYFSTSWDLLKYKNGS